MRIKIRTPVAENISVLDDSATIQDLLKLEAIDSLFGEIVIKSGYPPRPIDLKSLDIQLESIGIKNGDKIVVEKQHILRPDVRKDLSSPDPDERHKKSKRRSNLQTTRTGTYYVKLPDYSNMVLREVPSDNSCLFRSFASAFFRDPDQGTKLRQIVSEKVLRDQKTWTGAILGSSPENYAKNVLKDTFWGGAIELQILGKQFGISIQSLDIKTGRIDLFNPGCENFIVVLYSGIHFDCFAITVLNDVDDTDLDITLFDRKKRLFTDDDLKFFAKELNSIKGFVTDPSSIETKCNVCGSILIGEKQVAEHALKTKHTDFGEVSDN
ncbi:hypothetical protein WICMUC_000593 [Wickerhamomyces mucosus]|uniref:Ubiquitin thioesterase OTU n=1 Tax=Wickerhamomyces mucosus TaxID=1378264 RepID=A0A9P8TIG9_9ASCO|nr:hypothetical protein WICMUC_000593 [Wickerhamomyces mucosus]